MVGFLKAFGNGLFEGFNDVMEAEDAVTKQKEIIRFQNSFKEEVIDENEYETLSYLDSSTGKMITENLYALRNRKDYNEGEFDAYRMEKFYTDEISSSEKMEAELENNPARFAALVRKGDKFAYSWHNNPKNYIKNESDGEITYNKGTQYPTVQNSWHKSRFNQIALAKVPRDDYGLPALRMETNQGVFFQNQNKPITEWGYNSKEELYKDINEMRYITNDSRSADEILASKEAGFFKTYAKLKPVIANIHASNHNLSIKNLNTLQQEFNGLVGEGDEMAPQNPYFYGNYNNQFEFLKMIAPTWLMSDSGSTYGKVKNPVKYMTKHLGLEPKAIAGRRDAAVAAGITINNLLDEFVKDDGSLIFDDTSKDGEVAKYGVAKWIVGLKEGLFGVGGLTEQMQSLASKYGVENKLTGKRAAALNAAVVKATGDPAALAIAQRDVFYELLAYQVAAAIQGGTGGRTISDADVANIKKALGISGLSTGPLQYRRLSVLKGFMKQIELLNSGYTSVGSNMKNVVAAGQMHQLLLGGNIQTYTSGSFYSVLDTKMNNLEKIGAVKPLDPNVKEKLARKYELITGVYFSNSNQVEEYITNKMLNEDDANDLRTAFSSASAPYN